MMDLSDLVHGMKPKSRDHGRTSSKTHASSGEEKKQSDPSPRSFRKRQDTSLSGQASSSSQLHSQRMLAPAQGTSKTDAGDKTLLGMPFATKVGGSSDTVAHLLCDLCERTFDSKDKFEKHYAVFHKRARLVQNTREATFRCSSCGKAFTSPSKRNVHQNATHRGLRPFQCEICPKSFGYKGDLTKHMATHSGIKAHSCYICGARFARNFYVKRHIETVHEKKEYSKKRKHLLNPPGGEIRDDTLRVGSLYRLGKG